MAKVNFRKLMITGIEGQQIKADVSKDLGNQLYMTGRDIKECELGKRIYYDGEVELTEDEETIVRNATKNYAYVAREAVEKAITESKQ